MKKIINITVNNRPLNEITANILGPNGSYWQKNKKYIIYNFALRLYQYSAGKMFDCSIHKTTNILPEDPKKREKITDKIRGIRYSATRAQQFQRLLIGSYGIFETLTSKKCNMSSKKANALRCSGTCKSSDFVSDHIIGVTSIGKFTTETFKKDFLQVKDDADWSRLSDETIKNKIEKMCDDWLPNNLWLWAMCRITKNEHKSSNLKRGIDVKISDKKKLYHYNEAKIIIEEYK